MTAASSSTRIHSNISMAFPHGCALLPFNAFPGPALGEHANGPQAHSVAIQGFEFEYRALEALAQGNSTGQIVGEAIKNSYGDGVCQKPQPGGRQGEVWYVLARPGAACVQAVSGRVPEQFKGQMHDQKGVLFQISYAIFLK